MWPAGTPGSPAAGCSTDVSGKLDQVSVRQSPETQLVGPLVEALNIGFSNPHRLTAGR
jgi:hypothetical protein